MCLPCLKPSLFWLEGGGALAVQALLSIKRTNCEAEYLPDQEFQAY